MKLIDPHGKIYCDDCDCTGKPPGGVKTVVTVSKVTKSFERPEGWAVTQDGAVLCARCAAAAVAVAKPRKRTTSKVLHTNLYGDAPSSFSPSGSTDGNSRKGSRIA